MFSCFYFSGVSFTVCSLYIAEIAPKQVRGQLLVSVPIGMNFGLIFAMVRNNFATTIDFIRSPTVCN